MLSVSQMIQNQLAKLAEVEKSISMEELKGSDATRKKFVREWQARLEKLESDAGTDPLNTFEDMIRHLRELYGMVKDDAHTLCGTDWLARVSFLEACGTVEAEDVSALGDLLNELQKNVADTRELKHALGSPVPLKTLELFAGTARFSRALSERGC